MCKIKDFLVHGPAARVTTKLQLITNTLSSQYKHPRKSQGLRLRRKLKSLEENWVVFSCISVFRREKDFSPKRKLTVSSSVKVIEKVENDRSGPYCIHGYHWLLEQAWLLKNSQTYRSKIPKLEFEFTQFIKTVKMKSWKMSLVWNDENSYCHYFHGCKYLQLHFISYKCAN